MNYHLQKRENKNLFFEDYRQIELSRRYKTGQTTRNIVIDIASKDRYFGETEVHLSVGRFKNLYKYIMDHDNSVAGLNDNDISIYYDNIVFDIDSMNLRSITDLMQRIENNFHINPINIGIYFSGNKGFHIEIPSRFFGLQPSKDLHRVIEIIAIRMAGNTIEIDKNIYRKNSTIRLVNTLNSKSGLYKIPLYLSELTTIDEIKNLAKKPRKELCHDLDVKSDQKLINWVKDIYIEHTKPIQHNNTSTKNKDDLSYAKLCIVEMFKGVVKGNEPGRKNVAFRLAVHLAEDGLPETVVHGALVSWNNLNNPPLPETIINSVVKSAYNGNYSFGCNDEVKGSFCNSKCFLYKHKENGE